jgi:hypothetical protein
MATMPTIRKFWRKHVVIDGAFAKARPVVCADGFTMSVQASEFHYCSPRRTLKSGDYRAWEVGFPSKREPALLPYAEEKNKPCKTVYGCVPTAIIEAVIERHGGLKE